MEPRRNQLSLFNLTLTLKRNEQVTPNVLKFSSLAIKQVMWSLEGANLDCLNFQDVDSFVICM